MASRSSPASGFSFLLAVELARAGAPKVSPNCVSGVFFPNQGGVIDSLLTSQYLEKRRLLVRDFITLNYHQVTRTAPKFNSLSELAPHAIGKTSSLDRFNVQQLLYTAVLQWLWTRTHVTLITSPRP
ncbi:hypothetical protein TNCV_2577341 [Trichonephila clavipes]|nr:hypothetical protein TNCV_2577341 [Trichonephila clavipes]